MRQVLHVWPSYAEDLTRLSVSKDGEVKLFFAPWARWLLTIVAAMPNNWPLCEPERSSAEPG